MQSSDMKEAWTLDQLAKSAFFHQKLHDYGLLAVSTQIEAVKGEGLDWNCQELGISQTAWNKVIHRGIKPVIVFAHPQVLIDIPRSLGYYRMLSMVSQKSMKRVGLNGDRYEQGRLFSDWAEALGFANHINKIISLLIEADDEIDPREFDLWRGMAAGSQAQGSWQNVKGDKAEVLIKSQMKGRLRAGGQIAEQSSDGSRMILKDGRQVVFGDEPDVGLFGSDGTIQAAVEIKGGIDTAGVLERIGAALKSLSRAKEENPGTVTVLLLQRVSLTERALSDLETNRRIIDHWATIEDMLDDEEQQERIFTLLAI